MDGAAVIAALLAGARVRAPGGHADNRTHAKGPTMPTRTLERTQFLADLVTTAIENGGYGWFAVSNYTADVDDNPAAVCATIHENADDGDTGKVAVVDINTMARGLSVIRAAVDRPFPALVWNADTTSYENGHEHVLANSVTGQRLYLAQSTRKRLLEASRANDAGDIDAIDALAILECAVFGAVTYA